MTEPERPQGDVFHHAFLFAGIDIVSDPDGIVDQKKDAGDDILDQGLGAETDRQADHAGTGYQGGDVNTDGGQGDQCHHDDDHHQHELAQISTEGCRCATRRHRPPHVLHHRPAFPV